MGGAAKPHAGKGPAGGRGEGTHRKHEFHACDAGRVEAERLIEVLCELPSRKRLAYEAGVEVRAGR